MDHRNIGGAWTRRGRMAGLALALCGGVAAGPASAQWAVVDLPHTMKTALGWVAQYQQMAETYQRQVEQLDTLDRQYEQALVTGEAYSGASGHRERFQRRDEDAGLAERCGTGPARNPGAAELRASCASIVRTGNRRFNALVAMLESVDARDGELRAAYAERAGIRPEEEGRLASNTNRILSIQGQLQNDVQSGERLMAAYDATLRALRENHVRLANEALDGSPGAAIARGVALKVALGAARERER
ncbi:hypothetical protein [Luteimonas granuli]|uniref:Type IV secretion system protein VirB5 n=1 Tax=Luteimonas granuli TaxID=1176533 RepID=A0A518N626_9GAMM|nr:hypothetical protein [Luteimonas granuli]QDW67365.1 hypothetical protein FPZ22_11115 [Luteimonas granuli]